MPIEYYIGIAVGVISVLAAYVISKLTTRCGAKCDKCKETVSAIEQWSKKHPIITNAMKFKEVFGDKAIYAISSPNVQALKNWLDEPYKEQGDA